MTTAAAPVADSATTTPPDAPSEPFADVPTTPPPAEQSPAAELTAEELLRLENERLKRELASMVEDRHRAAELVDEADRADDEYESAKARAKKAKEARETAKASLRALIHGDAQVKIDLAEKDDGSHAPGQVAAGASTLASDRSILDAPGRAVAATYGCWQFGITRDEIEKADVSALRQIEPEVAKRKVDAIAILGDKPYVPLEQACLSDGSGFFTLWPLLDTDDWNSNHAEKYAGAVRDLGDESPDITARRRTGGEFNGTTVKVGRRKLVVGPDDQAVRVVYAPDGVNGADGGYLASKLLGVEPAKAAEILSFPAAQLPDRIAARLREHVPTGVGEDRHHEALASSLANDLKAEAGDIVKAAENDDRFDVRMTSVFGAPEEIVRLLKTDEKEG